MKDGVSSSSNVISGGEDTLEGGPINEGVLWRGHISRSSMGSSSSVNSAGSNSSWKGGSGNSNTQADEFNYSSNPTYIDENTGKIVVIPDNRDLSQLGKKSFSFITSVGMYNANDDLLAVAKLSRPVEKNDEKDLTIRVRLDY